MTDFFTKNVDIFKQYVDKSKLSTEHWNNVNQAASSLDFEKTDPNEINNFFIYLVVKFMSNNPKEWDKYGTQNANWIGEQLLGYLNEVDKEDENYLLYVVFRFMHEFYLTCGYDIENAYVALINYYLSDQFKIPSSIEREFNYAIKAMPLAILRGVFSQDLKDKLSKVESLIEKSDSSLKTIENFDSSWDKKLVEREKKINALDEKLKQHEHGFNFVGLYDGFGKLRLNKTTELDDASESVKKWKQTSIVLPCLSLLVLILLAYFPLPNTIGTPYFMLPLFTLFGLSLYFYRIALIAQKSIKSQLLQIDLRMTLCQFIQSYAEYSQDLKTKNENSLQKFEDIIFSGVVANDEKLPTSFDGLEQLSKLIQAVKK